MKRTTLIFIALLTINRAWAQNSNLESSTALKLYNLSYFEESTRGAGSNSLPFNYKYTTKTSAIINPTFAFQWKTQKNNLQEIELTSVRIGKTGSKQEAIDKSNYNSTVISGSDISSSIISARYERIATFNKKKETKFVPSLGFGVNPFYKREKTLQKYHLPTVKQKQKLE